MSTCFRKLPEDCVQLIFDRIPTSDLLLHVRRVSRAWQRHQQLNCRARKSLIIVQREMSCLGFTNQIYNQPFIVHNIDHNGNPRNYEFYIEHNQILISFNKTPKDKFLIKTFPYLNTLTVYTSRTVLTHIQSFVRLITHYSSKLATLQFYFEGIIRTDKQETSVSDIMRKFTNKLNSFTSLQHLTFHIEPYYKCYGEINRSTNLQIDVPEFLTRIREIYFNFISVETVMVNWMRKYEKAGRLSQLERFYFTIDSRSLPVSNQFDNYPHSNLYSFVPYKYLLFDNYENCLKRIVARFSSLTTITYTIGDGVNSLPKLSAILSPLTKLVHCELNIEVVVVSSDVQLNPNSLNKLSSIKALDLVFTSREYIRDSSEIFPKFCQTQVPTMMHIFPNLQSIRIEIINREICDSVTSKNALKQVAEKFFQNLKVSYGRQTLRTEYKDECFVEHVM